MCEGANIKIKCNRGYFISNISGWYGRKDSVSCTPTKTFPSNCNLDITQILINSFTGKNQYTVKLSNAYTGKNPCRNIQKYALISYSCSKQLKSGSCPALNDDTFGTCAEYCSGDYSCSGSQKCVIYHVLDQIIFKLIIFILSVLTVVVMFV